MTDQIENNFKSNKGKKIIIIYLSKIDLPKNKRFDDKKKRNQ